MVSEYEQKKDSIALRLQGYVTSILVIVFGLLPLLFVPVLVAPFGYTKVMVVLIALCISLVLYSLSVLRSGVVAIGVSFPLCALWSVAIIAGISSLLSGSLRDSLMGYFFSIHSTVFVAMLALVATVWMIMRPSKIAIMKTYLLLVVSALVLVCFHTLRLIFGADFFSLGIFTGITSSPVGTWNDLALFLGLTIILSLVCLEQLYLTKVGRGFLATVTILSLCLLGVINFFTVWIVIGFASLVLVVYTLGKDRFSKTRLSHESPEERDLTSFFVALVVFVVSAFFMIGGASLGSWISHYTQVDYVEVRPSLEATSNIARSVYVDNAFLGVGPNKFVDAWRLHKDQSINTTLFWNTDFRAGSGYITTFFVTTGVLGGLAWVVFLVSYFITGVRKLFSPVYDDKVWYFIGVSSFVSSLYVWGVSIIYVPGPVILLIGALCTGISLRAFHVLSGLPTKEIAMNTNRRTGFVLTFIAILVIVASVGVVNVAVRHYSSIYTFNKSLILMQEGGGVAEIERKILDAYALSVNDVFLRRIAEYQLARLNSLVQLTELTEAQALEFSEASTNGIRFAQEAIRIDGEEPANWAVLADIYSVLTLTGIEGAADRAREALIRYRNLDPQSPIPYLKSAMVEIRDENYVAARANIEEALNRKSNYSEAFYMLAQLAVVEGNVDEAIRSTQAVISLEPRNPTQYYQLGVLESSRNKVDAAIAAFESAVAIDRNYANARYLLAFAYDLKGEVEKAREQLEVVLVLNRGNENITQLINVLDEEGSFARLRNESADIIPEPVPVTIDSGSVITSQENTETTLITPVNTVPLEAEENEND